MLRRSDKARISKPKNGAIDANGTISHDDSKNLRCRGVSSVNAKKFLKFRLAVVTTTTVALLLCVVAKLMLNNDSSNWPAELPLIRTLGTKKLISYQCPAVDKKGAIDVANNTQRVYLYQNQIRGQFQNFPLFLETFRKKTYDQLAFSWEHAKKDNYDWKSRMFDLSDGDSVYESASGIGLNLYQTMEILQEVKGIESLVLYGNDYLDISVEKSNQLYDQAPPRGAIKGQFCQSDSKNLSFVPSNSFDLVFTGYITPLFDPLGIESRYSGKPLAFYRGLCNDKDLKSVKLLELIQEKQDDHVAQWVKEMIRIAKPGKPVIVELVSPPICELNDLMGLVPRSFWKSAVDKYELDVDAGSIVIETSKLMEWRYNVFMRKNS